MSTSPQSPESNQPLPTSHPTEEIQDAQRRESESTTRSTELSSVTLKLRKALRNFPDFPIPGIDFVDILPLFANHDLHESLIRALELQVLGFLFGPSLALRLGAGFAPVRKRGKLPGPTEEASFEKEYGQDYFQIQKDAIKPGQSVLVVDDIIATGGSAQAAGKLVQQLGGHCMGYLFILELDFLHGRDKLSAPVATLLRD
ncbi:adenine phosphoribosyltransferase [Botrytis cinerea]